MTTTFTRFGATPSDYIFNVEAVVAPTASDDASLGCVGGTVWTDTHTSKVYLCADNTPGAASWVEAGGGGSATIPAGLIAMWAGTLTAAAALAPDWYLCDGTHGTPDLRDMFIKGWAAGVDPGGTGGNASGAHTHADGSLATDSVSAGTPAGTNTGGAVDAHASHTHTYDDVIDHTHSMADLKIRSSASGSDATIVNGIPDTSATLDAASPYMTGNPSPGSVAQGTTDGPSASLTHAVTQPTFGGSALAGHAHDVTGATASTNNEPAYYKLAYIMKA